MAETAHDLFPDSRPLQEERMQTGILPSQQIRTLVRKHGISATDEIGEDQIQPASLDLRLGPTAHRIRASFLPSPEHPVADKIAEFATHEFSLTEGAVLERGCVYLVKLQEHLKLTRDISGVANPKSSIGRLDVFTRVITEEGSEFDQVSAGYEGPLYAEISPLTFSIIVHAGSRLNQLRLVRGNPVMPGTQTAKLLGELGQDDPYRGGSAVSVDLRGDQGDGAKGGKTRPIGYRARKHTAPIDVDARGRYEPLDFWEPLQPIGAGGLILAPDEFYILVSREAFRVPPGHAAEMVAYDTLVGEFRVHYAGFFDPGFGHEQAGDGSPSGGTRAVLEVRSHEVPFMVEDGQTVGRLLYERLSAEPDKLYGPSIGSSYQHQGLTLGKQFKPFEG
ncbi:MAG TPA: 2'-deoxycytidine 5'-triphosphate deaminase [Alphaproteobacteria bacterium]|nr:2'-deoxycytidine 5'-triphosphate deaminase [Alphaproteobacteria bacterium]